MSAAACSPLALALSAVLCVEVVKVSSYDDSNSLADYLIQGNEIDKI
jgi:hypothetical protein